ncbi:sodium/phosphate symporter [Natronomonas marina]|uniref:sodium/phosphate symporter n=1 Tax=Natronomonas marina TaxID=2961939 RepID=UPI0020C9EFB7|nr:sodium/phosphate symporter [Natronomonas marina]
MSDRRSYLLVGLAVFAVAAAMRTIPLYWSPLPHVLDGFAVASFARETVASGHLPISPALRADFPTITTLTASTAIIIGERPLHTIQPMMSVVGATIPLLAMAFTRRLGQDLGWPSRKIRTAVLACGLLLAVQGLFLRHTSIPDPEPLGQLFALIAIVSMHRLLVRRGTVRWGVLLVMLLLLFPIVHKFSTFNAALVLTALVGAEFARRPSRRTAVIGSSLVGGFWMLFAGYYELVEQLGILGVAYVSRVSSHPGLFVGWVVVLIVGVVWYQVISTRLRRALFFLPFGALFVLVAVNVVRPVFPGTIQSPPTILFLVSFLFVPVVFAGYGLFALSRRYETATLVTALLGGPLVVIYFSLTASLTPEFFATAIRGQAFLHVPAFVLVGLATASVAWRARGVTGRRGVRAALVGVLAVSTLLTAPLAFVALDTLDYPGTTPESEFEAVGHVATYVDGRWTTDHGPGRVGGTIFDYGAALGPTRTWLRGGPPPGCPMLSFDGWVTNGANFWPAAPEQTNRARYETTLAERNVVYTSNGWESIALSVPASDDRPAC